MPRRKMTPETRYAVMSSIRKRDTKPEIAMRRALWAAGMRGWRCYAKDLPGTPDIVFPKARVAVHVDGVWWHGHPDFFKPRRVSAYWRQKIGGNRARDRVVDVRLAELSWKSVRFWDMDVLRREEACVGTIRRVVEERAPYAAKVPYSRARRIRV